VGPGAGLDRCGKSRPPPKFDARTVQLVASCYTDYPYPAHWNMEYESVFHSIEIPISIAGYAVYYEQKSGK